METYRNVEVNFIRGKEAVLTVYVGESYDARDSWEVKEAHTLSDYKTKGEIHALMIERGFTLKSDEELEEMKRQKQREKEEELERQRLEKEEEERKREERRAKMEKQFAEKKVREETHQQRLAEAGERNRKREELKQMAEAGETSICSVKDGSGCDEREKAYIKEMKGKSLQDRKAQLERLNKMHGASMKPNLKQWMVRREKILKQLTVGSEDDEL